MKEEKILRAIGGIDDDLIDSAMAAKKKTHPAWVRWAAVAACLCLLLVSPVGAEMIGMLKVMIGLDGYPHVSTSERITIYDFSETAKLAIMEQKEDDQFYTMDDCIAAEEFLGLDLPDNPIIDSAEPQLITLDTPSGTYEAPCLVELCRNEEHELESCMIWAAYSFDDGSIDVYYTAATEAKDEDDDVTIGIPWDTFDREQYLTENGTNCVIFDQAVDYAFAAWEVRGFAVIDGYLVKVRVCEWSRTEALATLKQILNAYG